MWYTWAVQGLTVSLISGAVVRVAAQQWSDLREINFFGTVGGMLNPQHALFVFLVAPNATLSTAPY